MGLFKKLSSDFDIYTSKYRIILLDSEKLKHQQGQICGFEFYYSETEENINHETLHILFGLIRETNSKNSVIDMKQNILSPSYSIEVFGSWTYNGVDKKGKLAEMPLQHKFTVRFFEIGELNHLNQMRVGSVSFKKPIPVQFAPHSKILPVIPATLKKLICDLSIQQPNFCLN